jgi:hypothetical protein
VARGPVVHGQARAPSGGRGRVGEPPKGRPRHRKLFKLGEPALIQVACPGRKGCPGRVNGVHCIAPPPARTLETADGLRLICGLSTESAHLDRARLSTESAHVDRARRLVPAGERRAWRRWAGRAVLAQSACLRDRLRTPYNPSTPEYRRLSRDEHGPTRFAGPASSGYGRARCTLPRGTARRRR